MKNVINKSSKTLLASMLAGILVASSATVMAEKPKASDTAKASDATKILTERNIRASFPGWKDSVMGNIAVYSGQALIRHLQMAEKTLDEKKIGEAKSALTAAKDFAGGLQKMIPFLVVVDQVKDAKGKILESEDGIVIDDLLPVFTSIDQMEVYAPELAKTTREKLKEVQKHAKAGKKREAGKKLEEIIDDITATTVYMPVLYVSNKVNKALQDLDAKTLNTKAAKVNIVSALNSLIAASVSVDAVKLPKEMANKKSVPAEETSKKITAAIRAQLIRVKQSVAFAENLQTEVKHDPQDIFQSLDNASVIVSKILTNSTLSSATKTKLESVKAGIKNIKGNLNDKSAYKKVRDLLEGLTDNPGE